MPLNVPTFLTRTASSVVFVAIMLTGLLWDEWSFIALACLINFLCLREYFKLMRLIDKEYYCPRGLPAVFHISAFSGLLYLCSFVALSNSNEQSANHLYTYVYLSIFGVPYIFAVIFGVILVWSFIAKKEFFIALFKSIGGLLYITLPMFFLFSMYSLNKYLPIMLIAMIWSNDTMAYLVGSFFGKTPFSSISPKKTWEGTIGGALVTIVAAGITGHFLNTFHLIDWVVLALCATVAGTFGDLMESKLKRLADVKDSGAIMPGHGGALDRFDSLLIAIPFAYVYVSCFMR